MPDYPPSLIDRALADVENFSEKQVAVLPQNPSTEMLRYIAHVTGEDFDKLKRIYELFIAVGRLDGIKGGITTGSGGFGED